MYQIELYFKSNVSGVYTHWSETADSDYWFKFKLNRILDYWLESMCPYIDKTTLPYTYDPSNLQMRLKYELIQNHIRHLNSMNKEGDVERKFTIECREGSNEYMMDDHVIDIF